MQWKLSSNDIGWSNVIFILLEDSAQLFVASHWYVVKHPLKHYYK